MAVSQAQIRTSWKAVAAEEIRLMLRRHGWKFLAIVPVVALYFGWPRFRIPAISASLTHVNLEVGGPWSGVIVSPLLYFMLGMYVALALWRDHPPDRRGHLYAGPMDTTSLNLLRIGIGAAVLTVALLTGLCGAILIWTWGPVYTDRAGFVLGVLPPWNWLIWIVGMLNIYVVGSIIGLLSRTPSRVVMLGLLGIMVLWCLAAYVPAGPFRTPLIPLLPPDGLLGGLGLTIWSSTGDNLEPAMAAPLIWFPILGAFTYLAARRAATVR